MTKQFDKVSHASLNGIYVKAQELDRGHNEVDAPSFAPPGAVRADTSSHASTHASDAQTRASDVPDAQTHASDSPDAQTHASDASDSETHAS